MKKTWIFQPKQSYPLTGSEIVTVLHPGKRIFCLKKNFVCNCSYRWKYTTIWFQFTLIQISQFNGGKNTILVLNSILLAINIDRKEMLGVGSNAVKEIFNQTHPFWTGRANELMFEGNREFFFFSSFLSFGNLVFKHYNSFKVFQSIAHQKNSVQKVFAQYLKMVRLKQFNR